jgi:Zn-finger protein
MRVEILGKNGPKIVDFNRRKGIRERCLNCSGWYHKEVTNCTFKDCPLYPFRSGKGKQNAKDRSKVIHAFCLWCMSGQLNEVSKCTSKNCPLFPYRKTKIDRSTELKPLPKKGHIELHFERKMEKEYLSMGNDGKL